MYEKGSKLVIAHVTEVSGEFQIRTGEFDKRFGVEVSCAGLIHFGPGISQIKARFSQSSTPRVISHGSLKTITVGVSILNNGPVLFNGPAGETLLFRNHPVHA